MLVLPRLNKRKKTASEILKPLMSQVQGTITIVSQQSDVDVQAVLDSLLLLSRSVPTWVGDNPDEQRIVAVGLVSSFLLPFFISDLDYFMRCAARGCSM